MNNASISVLRVLTILTPTTLTRPSLPSHTTTLIPPSHLRLIIVIRRILSTRTWRSYTGTPCTRVWRTGRSIGVGILLVCIGELLDGGVGRVERIARGAGGVGRGLVFRGRRGVGV
jgi:hypothetical protein